MRSPSRPVHRRLVAPLAVLAALVLAPAVSADCPIFAPCEPDPTEPPVARLSVSPNSIDAGQSVTLDASASTGGTADGNGVAIERYEWDADGDPSNGYEVDTGTTPTLTRSYPLAGGRSLRVRVTSSTGVDTAGRALTVRPVVAFEHEDDRHSNSPYVGYYFSAADGVSGAMSFQCGENGGAWRNCHLGPHPSDPHRQRGFALFGSAQAPLPEGRYTLDVKAVDPAGVESAVTRRSFTIDRTPPASAPQITDAPASVTNSTSATFRFGSTDAGVQFECGVDAEPTRPCNGSGFTASSLNQGFHTFQVVAVDRAGNRGPITRRTWEIDRIPPETSIVSGPAQGSKTTARSATFEFGGEARFECRLDGGSFGACSGPGDSHKVSGLSVSEHTFEVRSIDRAGNPDATPASRTWTVMGATTGEPPADKTRPRVVSVLPAAKTTGVARGARVIVTFSEAMARRSISRSTVTLVARGGSRPVSATVTLGASGRRAILDPRTPLRAGQRYTATVATGAKDKAGNALARARSWSFTTRG